MVADLRLRALWENTQIRYLGCIRDLQRYAGDRPLEDLHREEIRS